jgi:hypothetical protein
MSQSFDPSTPIGQVRLLAADFDLVAGCIFSDESYAAFLDLNNQSPRLAAAQALDVVATNEVIVSKVIKILDLRTDGASVQKALLTQANELRRQEYEGSGDMVGYFDYAEVVYDSFTARQRVVSQWLRTGV